MIAEPCVTLDRAGRKTKVLLDTGTAYSVLTRPIWPLSNTDRRVMGIDRQPEIRLFTFPLICEAGCKMITHFFPICS